MRIVVRPVVALLTFSLAALGCAKQVEPPRAAAVVTPAPAPPAPVWPDAAPAPDVNAPDAAEHAAEFAARAELPDLHFASGQIRVRVSDMKALDATVAWLRSNSGQLVIIEGYTDVLGARTANLALAQRRAQWVMEYLVSKGVSAGRITVVSRGEAGMVCAEKTQACESRNRRVHFLVRDSGPLEVSASPSH